MNCAEAEKLVAAYADGELDWPRRHSIGKHLRGCARCAAQHESVLALRNRLRAEVPYFAAPPGLHERVRAMIANTPASAPQRPSPAPDRWRWLGSGALAGCAATALAWVVGTAVLEWRVDRDLTVEAVSTHVRATLDKALIQVASSDQHTVKPWLSARLDYSPPVRDMAADGFPLLGGRLDTLGKRPCATLVYRYRNHMIDVFVRPRAQPLPALRSMRGFNVAHASVAGWDWLAVSDVSADVLTAFVEHLAREAAAQ
ncbi:MAG TPA: zf-HC2 domain-containing protein [Casimicrobiaceae bacterium]